MLFKITWYTRSYVYMNNHEGYNARVWMEVARELISLTRIVGNFFALITSKSQWENTKLDAGERLKKGVAGWLRVVKSFTDNCVMLFSADHLRKVQVDMLATLLNSSLLSPIVPWWSPYTAVFLFFIVSGCSSVIIWHFRFKETNVSNSKKEGMKS